MEARKQKRNRVIYFTKYDEHGVGVKFQLHITKGMGGLICDYEGTPLCTTAHERIDGARLIALWRK